MSEEKQHAYYNIVNQFSHTLSLKEAPFTNSSLDNAPNQEMADLTYYSPDDTSKVGRERLTGDDAMDRQVTLAEKLRPKSQQRTPLSTPDADVGSSSMQSIQSIPLQNSYKNECEYMDRAVRCHVPTASTGTQGQEMRLTGDDEMDRQDEKRRAKSQQTTLDRHLHSVKSTKVHRTKSSAKWKYPFTAEYMSLTNPEDDIISTSSQRMQSFPLPKPYKKECKYMYQTVSCQAATSSTETQGDAMLEEKMSQCKIASGRYFDQQPPNLSRKGWHTRLGEVTSAKKQRAKSQPTAMDRHLHSIKSTITRRTKSPAEWKYPFTAEYMSLTNPEDDVISIRRLQRYMDQAVSCHASTTSTETQLDPMLEEKMSQCKIASDRYFDLVSPDLATKSQRKSTLGSPFKRRPSNLPKKIIPRGLAAYLAQQKRISDQKLMRAMLLTQVNKSTNIVAEQNVGDLLWTVQKKEEAGTSCSECSVQDNFPITRPPPELKVGNNHMLDEELLSFSSSDDEDTYDEDTYDEDTCDEDTYDEDTSDEDTHDEDTSDEDTSDEDTSDEDTSDEDKISTQKN